MFDLDQTFSLYILPYEKMFDRLATSAKKACASGKKLPIRDGILVTRRISSAVIRKKRYVGSLCPMLVKHCLPV